MPLQLTIKDHLIRELSKHFDSKIQFEKRIRVLSDLDVFLPEDKYIWEQKKDRTAEYFQVYFDDQYICGFDEETPSKVGVALFWKGFTEAYKDKKVRLTPPWMRVEEKPKEETEKDRLKKIKPKTPEQKMAKAAVEKLVS